ncbi:hypothetical protein [Hymenobacter sedentarius]|nr:hypothetical protein [Hymenobacter sedentarius]
MEEACYRVQEHSRHADAAQPLPRLPKFRQRLQSPNPHHGAAAH